MNLDHDLVRQAAEALGTGNATETVHRALEEVVLRQRRISLDQFSFEALGGDRLKKFRTPRV